MPIKNNSDLPKGVRDSLPPKGQDMWREVFNHAYKEYANPASRRGNESQDEVAAKVAWDAVKADYKKVHTGKWIAKESSNNSDNNK